MERLPLSCGISKKLAVSEQTGQPAQSEPPMKHPDSIAAPIRSERSSRIFQTREWIKWGHVINVILATSPCRAITFSSKNGSMLSGAFSGRRKLPPSVIVWFNDMVRLPSRSKPYILPRCIAFFLRFLLHWENEERVIHLIVSRLALARTLMLSRIFFTVLHDSRGLS